LERRPLGGELGNERLESHRHYKRKLREYHEKIFLGEHLGRGIVRLRRRRRIVTNLVSWNVGEKPKDRGVAKKCLVERKKRLKSSARLKRGH